MRQREEVNMARQLRASALARILAASLMGLQKDPLGAKVPDELVVQFLKEARAVLTLIGR